MSELGGRIAAGVWRDNLVERRLRREAWIARALERLADVVLVLTLLYVLIGASPYSRGLNIDEATGGTELSPVNRYAWLGLMALSGPILLLRWRRAIDVVLGAWPVIAVFVWFGLTTTWALDPAASDRRFILYAVGLIICIALAVGISDRRRVLTLMAGTGGFVMIVDAVSWAVAPGLSMTEIGLAAIHSHKNTLGAVALFSTLACGTQTLVQTRAKGRILWGGLAALSILLLVASLSKTSMIILAGVLAAAPVLVFLSRGRVGVMWSAALAGFTILLGAVFTWTAVNLAMGADPLGPFRTVTFTMRTDVWKFALGEFAAHPWRGLGFGSFWDIDPRLQPSLKADLWFAQPDAATNGSHNGYIDLMVTTGIIGLAGGVMLLFRWIAKAWTLVRFARPGEALPLFLAVFVVAVFVHNFMESSYFTANSLFGFLVLLAGVLIEAQSRDHALEGR
ncbi:O-antigen ligase family protein [Caulobacter segnis]|uniref:O-antigen ligase family protein n=1 Tax=Caulobacter segnis TaxID=88688 RepID=UPI0024106468|nr:O-antigen ligase family protein [Caulobacter segnis]MDG2521168.1 O-antigen ligase family protein [Caulobacter segnis]